MSNGKDYRIYVSTTGATASTPLVEVEFQGDLTITTGKTAERTGFKNGSQTATGNSGFEASFTIGARTPIPTGQAELWEAHDNDSLIYCELRGGTGSVKYAGTFKVVITEISAPTSGAATLSITLSEDGQVTKSIVT